jgi:hypothetical protein
MYSEDLQDSYNDGFNKGFGGGGTSHQVYDVGVRDGTSAVLTHIGLEYGYADDSEEVE